MARGRPPRCIFCGSTRNVAKGVRRTKQLGVRRIRRCKDCNRKFTPPHQKHISDTDYKQIRRDAQRS